MSRKLGAWLLFLLFLILLSLGFTPYSQTANYILISVRLVLIAMLSVLFVRERWKYRHDPQETGTHITVDAGDGILRRWRRWYYDESK